jgi:hypothetical protein
LNKSYGGQPKKTAESTGRLPAGYIPISTIFCDQKI